MMMGSLQTKVAAIAKPGDVVFIECSVRMERESCAAAWKELEELLASTGVKVVLLSPGYVVATCTQHVGEVIVPKLTIPPRADCGGI